MSSLKPLRTTMRSTATSSIVNVLLRFWEYDDFAHRTRVRAALAADSAWQEKFLPAIRPCLLHQVSAVLIPSDVWPFTPASHGIYELRYYKLLPGRVGEWLAKFRTGLQARAKHGNTPVGVWTAELGGLNMVYHLWGYADLQDRADVRKKFADDPVWTEVVRTAVGAGGCRGWSLVIYNPDLDPDRSQAGRIVQFVTEVAPHLP